MNRILTLLGLSLALGSTAHGFGHGPGSGPEMGVAKVDEGEQVTIRTFSGSSPMAMETTVFKKNEKGQMVPSTVKVMRQTLEESVLTLPLKVVKGYDTDGKPIETKAVADRLAKETPVVIVVGEPKAAQLTPFRKGLLVLSIPVPVGPYYGGEIPAPPVPIPIPKTEDEKKPQTALPLRRTDTIAMRLMAVADEQSALEGGNNR